MSVTAHRGMLSRKPAFSMMVTISAGRVVLVSTDSPEAVIDGGDYPLGHLNLAVVEVIFMAKQKPLSLDFRES